MKPRLRLCALAFAALGLWLPPLAPSLAAQASDSSLGEARLRALHGISRGRVVRVARRGLPYLVGRAYRVSNDRLVLVHGQAADSLPVAGIDSAWVSVRKRNIVVLASVGAVAGWIIAGRAQAQSPTTECAYDAIGQCVGAWVLGASAGGLGGGAVGAVLPSWRLRFPR